MNEMKAISMPVFITILSGFSEFTKITSIKIDSSGELSNYPENMVDEWSNQLLKLL